MIPPPGFDIEIVEIDGQTLLLLERHVRPRATPTLTRAEQEVLEGLLRGESNAQIAAARGRSARTVANQLQSLFRKLGVGSRHELMAVAGK